MSRYEVVFFVVFVEYIPFLTQTKCGAFSNMRIGLKASRTRSVVATQYYYLIMLPLRCTRAYICVYVRVNEWVSGVWVNEWMRGSVRERVSAQVNDWVCVCDWLSNLHGKRQELIVPRKNENDTNANPSGEKKTNNTNQSKILLLVSLHYQ